MILQLPYLKAIHYIVIFEAINLVFTFGFFYFTIFKDLQQHSPICRLRLINAQRLTVGIIVDLMGIWLKAVVAQLTGLFIDDLGFAYMFVID